MFYFYTIVKARSHNKTEKTKIKMSNSKATKRTFNKLIKENNLFINVKSAFNGMIDGCETFNNGFEKVEQTDHCINNTYGINGAWLVNGGRDYFTHYENETLIGVEVYNACGSFVLATTK